MVTITPAHQDYLLPMVASVEIMEDMPAVVGLAEVEAVVIMAAAEAAVIPVVVAVRLMVMAAAAAVPTTQGQARATPPARTKVMVW